MRTQRSRTPPRPKRIETGVQRLDFILKGGLVAGSSYLLLGPPGSGKTVLGNQILFNHARAGGRGLYLTLLAESHARMLSNLSGMSFVDTSLVPDRLQYLSGYQRLERDGLDGLLALVRDAVRQQKATLLVIDGLDSADHFAKDKLGLKKFIHELQGYCALLGCTTLLLAPGRNPADDEESASVDGILELFLWTSGPRAVRELLVHKFRGSDYLMGRHEVEITERGIVVHPRTEVQFDAPTERSREDRVRMKFGLEPLDRAIGGGLLSGSATTLLGAPGTGKTLLGLKFLEEGARRGQPGVYFGFYETPPRLIEKAEAVGIRLRKAVKDGSLEIQWQPPLEHNLDALAERLLERIRERDVGGKRLRLFVDGIAGFRAATVYPDRMGRFLAALVHQLRMLDVTTLFSEEIALFSPSLDMPVQEVAGAVENVVVLRHVELRGRLYRLLSVMKVRESAYDSRLREFSVDAEGFHVAESFASAQAVLTGFAQPRDGGNSDDLPEPMGHGERPRGGERGKRGGR